MSTFAPMQQLLMRYHALEFHHNSALATRLLQIQNWQKKRMQRIHADLFAVPGHALMTAYFLQQLYGGPNFDVLAAECAHGFSAAKSIEGLFPNSVVRTALHAVELAVLGIELDQQLASFMTADLVDDSLDITANDLTLLALYRSAQQADDRRHQLDLLDSLGRSLEKYVRSTLVYGVFKMSRGIAKRRGLSTLYAFAEDGFHAMKPLSSAEVFVAEFTQGERDMIQRIYAGTPAPFTL